MPLLAAVRSGATGSRSPRRIFHEALADVTLDEFHAAVNHVAPSLIRVQADEVTYNLHIIVRFELEQALFSGDLPVADLPAAWNQKYQESLDVKPGNDAEGCLQDIHWSAGLIGYFPTYTLGNLYAAQLFAQAQADLGGLDEAFAQGDYSGLLAWLRAKVHSEGQRYRPAELIEHITGSKPDHRPLIATLTKKVLRAVRHLINERIPRTTRARSSMQPARERRPTLAQAARATAGLDRRLSRLGDVPDDGRGARALPRGRASCQESRSGSCCAIIRSHVEWVGCSLHDLIQPSFSFLVGVALPFSLAEPARERPVASSR